MYRLGQFNPSISEDGKVLYYHSIVEDKEGNVTDKYLVLDDKNVDQPTLGKRRLALKDAGVKLFKLKTAIFFVGDLLKLASAKTWFIDSSGKVFKHSKTRWAKLVHKRIKKVIRQQGGAIIEVEGIPSRFKVLYPPTELEIWAQVLVDGMEYIFYGVTDQLGKDSKRMI